MTEENKTPADNNGGEEDSVKCVVVGDGAVGKTCLLMSYSQDTFPETYVPTVFDNFDTKVMYQDRSITLGLWDTAGQEDYDRLRPLSYSDTDVFIICFSLMSPISRKNVTVKWVQELELYNPDAPLILAGTKLDMREEDPESKDAVSNEDGEALKSEINAFAYCECSAKTQKGVNEVFDAAIRAAFSAKESKKQDHKQKETQQSSQDAGRGGNRRGRKCSIL
eukprot:gb/GECH01013064.1/.p1 GENE.gb/GECH01013064.1/~~gb/GECH01013064.1/.p1  ORF type:complete len:222 (+),score=48.23 gb/GECH01013064.1/:1-666(+)